MIVTYDFNFKLPSERIHNRETRFYSIFCNFYRAMLSMSGSLYAMALCLTVCLAVCLSVTSRCSTKTAKHGITQTTPHDSSGILVFRCQRSLGLSRKRYKTYAWFLLKSNRKSYALYRMVTLPMTLSDP